MASQPKSEIATIKSEASQSFELMQREAQLFAASPLIPKHLRDGGPQQALANCYIALKMARTMGEDPLVVLQNIHVVSGKAGFASQYMIARANASGVFKGRINWRVDKMDPKNLSVTAFAKLADTEHEVEFTADMAMAQAEGWTKNPKYKTMPEVMLRYRSAAFLIRFYAPDVMLGYHTAEEVQDAGFIAAPITREVKPLTSAMLIEQAEPEKAAGTVEQVEASEDLFDADDDTPPYQSVVDEIIATIEDALKPEVLDQAQEDFDKHKDALPDDVVADIDARIARARRELEPA